MDFDAMLYEHIPFIPNRVDIFGEQKIIHTNGAPEPEHKLLLTGSDISIVDLPQLVEAYGGLCWPAHVDRDANGDVDFGEFDDLAKLAGNGFDHLVRDRSYPVFAGSNLPVKKLGWADMYSSMGITGFFCGITGEAAVNPQIPDVTLPFCMSHEMSHRKSIAIERDANFAAFLACQANDNVEYRYSGYFMAYRYCLNQLKSLDMASAKEIMALESDELSRDMEAYSKFFSSRKDEKATEFADTVNDTYLKANGDEQGIASYDDVCGMLVNWYIQQILIPTYTEEEVVFDPFDESQVDLSGITNAIIVETEPTEPAGGVG